jgi:uncharacterized protein (DUF305 family)
VRVLPRAVATAVAAPVGLAVAAALLSGCTTRAEVATAAPAATSPTAPVLQPGRPGQPNVSLTGTAAAPSPSAAVDADDVRFLQEMVVHHAQAVVMVDLARDHLTDPQVKALASRIADEQEPEIAYMAKLLRERRADVPPQAENPHFAANSHGGHGSMPGMATPQQLEDLAAARGVEADRLWLELMVAHHRGALAMVLDQQRHGSDDVVTQLGDEVHVTQLAQINHMQRMLDRLA